MFCIVLLTTGQSVAKLARETFCMEIISMKCFCFFYENLLLIKHAKVFRLHNVLILTATFKNFNPDPTKEAAEVCFSSKCDNVPHKRLTFNNNKIQSSPARKHLGLILDCKLDFKQHMDDKINKCNRIIVNMRRISVTLSRKSLLTIYRSLASHTMSCSNLKQFSIMYV